MSESSGSHDHVHGGCCGSKKPVQAKDENREDSNQVVAHSTKAFEASDERPIHFTEAAVAAVKKAIETEGQAGDGLRVSVVGGGCSGYQYNLDFEKEARMGDQTLDFSGVKIFIDPISAGYLRGTVIDYVSGLQGTGFKFNNPNAKRTCGCGHSFS